MYWKHINAELIVTLEIEGQKVLSVIFLDYLLASIIYAKRKFEKQPRYT